MSKIYVILTPVEDSLPYGVFSDLVEAKKIVDNLSNEHRFACIFEYNMNDSSYRKNIYDNENWPKN